MNRRALLKSLAGAFGASVMPAPIAKPMTIGVDMAKDHALDSMRYVMVKNYGTGFMEVFGYTVQGGERITTTRITPKA